MINKITLKGDIIMECRSEKKRQDIVDNYYVSPIAHIQLLSGQRKHSDAGQTITNDYYIFEAISKKGGEKEIIQCGMGAAKDFLKKINHKGLPLFNPLHYAMEKEKKNQNTYDSNGNGDKILKWNGVAKQLYNAIMWVIIIIDAKPNTPIYEIKDKIYKYKYHKPFPRQVKAVNTIIEKNIRGKILSQAINELKKENDIRADMCKFDQLIEIINNYTDKEGNRIIIESHF